MSRVPEPSVFLVVDEAKRKARERGVGLIDLSIGSTDLPPPEAPLKALAEALNDPTTYGYCLKSCTLPFLEEAARWYEGRYGVGLDPRREALALIGSQEGLAHLLLALTEPEDLLLLPEVAYPSYFGAARVASLRTFLIPLREDGLADLKAVPEGVWREAKVLLLNYPNNPTGAVYPKEVLEALARLAVEHDFYLVSDEIYEHLLYEGEHFSPGRVAPEHTLTVNGAAKAFAMTGWRIGYACGPKEVIKAMASVSSQSTTSPDTIAQWATLEALTNQEASRAFVEMAREAYRRRRDLLLEGLTALGLKAVRPSGAFYVLMDTSPIAPDEVRAAERLLEAGVAVVPGTDFAAFGHVRLSYATSEENLRKALERFARVLGRA